MNGIEESGKRRILNDKFEGLRTGFIRGEIDGDLYVNSKALTYAVSVGF